MQLAAFLCDQHTKNIKFIIIIKFMASTEVAGAKALLSSTEVAGAKARVFACPVGVLLF